MMQSANMVPLTRSSTSLDCKKTLLFKEVDVKYSDGMWYRGKITAYDEETDHYTVFFDTDGETTTFQLPDPDVKVIGLSDNDGEDDDFQ